MCEAVSITIPSIHKAMNNAVAFLVIMAVLSRSASFQISRAPLFSPPTFLSRVTSHHSKPHSPETTTLLSSSSDRTLPESEIVSCNLLVKGEVQGGYYRASVKNEVSNFRSLVGTLTENDDGTTSIYVEGKKKVIEGFIRWCGKSPGLTKTVEVANIEWGESQVGLFDGFYMHERV